MKLTILRDSYKGHQRAPWLVVLPARLSPTGRRKYSRFPTRQAAAEYVNMVRQHVRRNGENPATLLPAELAADAAAAQQLLVGHGLTLCEAVRKLLAAAESAGVACAASLPTRGAGEKVHETSGRALRSAHTVNAAIAAMEAEKSHQRLATIRARRGVLSRIRRWRPAILDTPMESLTHEHLRDLLDSIWPHSATTWNTARRHLHALFSFSISRRFICMENPLTCIKLKHVQETEIKALPADGLRRLFAACRPPLPEDGAEDPALTTAQRRHRSADLTYLRPYIAICAFAGVRPTECASIRWHDIDFEDNIISVRVAHAKTGAARHIQLLPALAAWLKACRPADAAPEDLITPSKNLQPGIAEVRRRAGFADTWQNDCLRHSFATYYLKSQLGDIHRLQVNMGHRDAQLLYTRYTNMAGVNRAASNAWWQVLPA